MDIRQAQGIAALAVGGLMATGVVKETVDRDQNFAEALGDLALPVGFSAATGAAGFAMTARAPVHWHTLVPGALLGAAAGAVAGAAIGAYLTRQS